MSSAEHREKSRERFAVGFALLGLAIIVFVLMVSAVENGLPGGTVLGMFCLFVPCLVGSGCLFGDALHHHVEAQKRN